MLNKKRTSLLPVQVISVISKQVHHYSPCSTCSICYNNENGFMNGNQQGVTPYKLMPLWLFAKDLFTFFQMLSSSKATTFWINLTRDQNDKASQYNFFSKQKSVLEGDESEKRKSKQQAKLVKEAESRVVEGDTLVNINNRSLSSIFKSKRKFLFQSFNRLDADNKAICAYCLNGILDMTNISTGQKRLFSQQQWEYLQKKFDSTQDKHLPRLSSKLNNILDKIEKMILDGDPQNAYYLVLSSVVDFPKHEQWVLKVLYHIVYSLFQSLLINAYNHRSYIFTATKDATEFDYMAKIWCELFELIFDQDAQYLKWGESVSSTTTAAKKANNDNSKNTIGCKVDGRILCRIDSNNDILDICQIEAAKSTQDHAKNILDRAKLAIETKCIIDDTVTRPNFSTSVNQYQVQSVQLCGIQAQVSRLTLVDKGLYVHITSHTISLKQDVLEFAKDMKKWIRRLMKFKNTCYLNMATYSSSTVTPPKDINKAFGHEQPSDNTDHYCNA